MSKLDGAYLHIDSTGVEQEDLWRPNSKERLKYIDNDGILIFVLPPYIMTQMVIGSIKTAWYYINIGDDGIAIRGFTQAKMVLEQTMEWHQEAQLRALEQVTKGEES